jgi:hypothetical protein
MPLVTTEYKVDLFQLKHTNNPVALLEALSNSAARSLGEEIVKNFPFLRDPDRSYPEGKALPNVSFNKDHEYVDVYRSRFFLLTEEDHARLLEIVRNNFVHQKDYETLKQILST